jgi:hypothetical protein
MGVKKKMKKKDKKSQVQPDEKDCCIYCHEDMSGDDVDALACEICDLWSCRDCINVPADVYKFLEETTDNFPFICKVCTPRLPEMREMFDLKKSHADLQEKVSTVETKQQQDETRLTTLELQVEELTTSHQTQTAEVRQLNETITEMKAKSLDTEGFPDLLTANPPQKFLDMITKHVHPAMKPLINTQISEREKIEFIKHNLVISGMAENTNTQDDAVKFTQMIKDEMDLIVDVESTERLQRKTESEKPKLLKVVLKDMKMRKAILSKAVTLRNSQNEHVKTEIYIRPELTSNQLEE